MTDPRWINRQALLLKHAESLRLFGGAEGLRDEGMLDSALARPFNEERITHLAAAYAFGLSKNHPFIDGNKRAAFIAYVGFLKLNGFNLVASQPEAYRTMIELAAGTISEEEFAMWIQANIEARQAL
ncbi:type II toxin-antitoxin system death-on-curing family toxin [Microvirga zambiensis]|uniref:type II toxin-antitoxin system death-on-curing family toxin n=1 Tax=Microvirga zambiensis TaxID=1402137 RepID=UPI00191FBE71|nr:type II toxin-antitoxin system death-on-curing family toxin [Microvirga zambiensis]